MNIADHIVFFKTLANKQRIRILHCLMSGPKTVTEIVHCLNAEQSTVSHNLKCLLQIGCIEVTPQGKNRRYNINTHMIQPIFTHIDKHIDKFGHIERCPNKRKTHEI